MSLKVPSRGGARCRLALAAGCLLTSFACSGNPLSSGHVSSTPVATPIVVSNSPVPARPSPKPETVDPKTIEVRRKAISDVIGNARKTFPGHSAVVFLDLDNGTRVEFEPNAKFESASLVKLVILAELYRQFQVGEHTPEETVVLLDSQKMGGSGRLKESAEGSQHTLKALAEAMITDSDNTATQMLTDLLGREKVEEGAKALGLKGTTVQRDIFDFAAIDQGRDNYITAQDTAFFLQQLARQELPGSQQMHEILERQKRNDMIGKNFPAGVKVAHKTGELDGILHDAAIVYAPRGAFVLVTLSDQVSDKEAAKKSFAQMAQDILKVYSASTASPTPTPSR